VGQPPVRDGLPGCTSSSVHNFGSSYDVKLLADVRFSFGPTRENDEAGTRPIRASALREIVVVNRRIRPLQIQPFAIADHLAINGTDAGKAAPMDHRGTTKPPAR
jgi:hypothetical protein